MRYRRLDMNHDYTFGQGTKDYLSGIDALTQAIETHLKLFLGEWWEDTKDGLPMFQSFLGAPGSRKEVKDRLLIERILQLTDYGVRNIESIQSTQDSSNGAYEVQIIVNTIYGPLTVTN